MIDMVWVDLREDEIREVVKKENLDGLINIRFYHNFKEALEYITNTSSHIDAIASDYSTLTWEKVFAPCEQQIQDFSNYYEFYEILRKNSIFLPFLLYTSITDFHFKFKKSKNNIDFYIIEKFDGKALRDYIVRLNINKAYFKIQPRVNSNNIVED